MATLTADRLTLVEIAKRTHNGMAIDIAEQLNKDNAVLDDAVYVQANGISNHITTKRLSLPTGSWRQINAGVARESSRTQQVVETIGRLEAYSQIDSALVDLAPDKKKFRWSEDISFLEGMSQTLATAIFYGSNVGAPEQFNGFATRYASTSDDNVWSLSGTGSDLASVWIVQWGSDKVHMVYPANDSAAGLQAKDDGLLTTYDDSNNPYKVYQTHFRLYAGMVVRDDRCIQRLCNIETAGSSNILDEDYLIKALRQMPQGGSGAVIYMNKTIMTQLDIIAKDKSNVSYTPDGPFGRPQISFRGYPIKLVDALLDTESAVS